MHVRVGVCVWVCVLERNREREHLAMRFNPGFVKPLEIAASCSGIFRYLLMGDAVPNLSESAHKTFQVIWVHENDVQARPIYPL